MGELGHLRQGLAIQYNRSAILKRALAVSSRAIIGSRLFDPGGSCPELELLSDTVQTPTQRSETTDGP
jgi:hypothetical protein